MGRKIKQVTSGFLVRSLFGVDSFPPARKSVEFYSGDLKTLVDLKLAPRYRNIWLVGGARLCQRFLELGLADEINLTVAPRLFGSSPTEQRWSLKNVVAHKNGFVELSYSAPTR